MLGLDSPLLIALVYQPPSSKNFILQFSDFLSDTMSNHDRVLILGDFNIHVCCPSKPMVSDFLHLTRLVLPSSSLTLPIGWAIH